MSDPLSHSVSRRDFGRLASAALTGMVAGSLLTGCDPANKGTAAKDAKEQPVAAAGGKNACRGLNECKGHGADGKNACAGQGACASASAKHDCSGQNECKNLGGCGATPGGNECKSKGGCAVPMTHGDSWDRARVAFEARMKAAGKPVGAAPQK